MPLQKAAAALSKKKYRTTEAIFALTTSLVAYLFRLTFVQTSPNPDIGHVDGFRGESPSFLRLPYPASHLSMPP